MFQGLQTTRIAPAFEFYWNNHHINRFVCPTADPYIHKLAGKCTFTLRMLGNMSRDVVALPADSTDMLVEQICQDLDCGDVFHVNKTSSPPNAACFHDCLYQDGRLQNCSQSVGSNCTVIASAVCGKIFLCNIME